MSLKIMDENVTSDDVIGSADINLEEILKKRNFKDWVL
jgi:hypothetical protein